MPPTIRNPSSPRRLTRTSDADPARSARPDLPPCSACPARRAPTPERPSIPLHSVFRSCGDRAPYSGRSSRASTPRCCPGAGSAPRSRARSTHPRTVRPAQTQTRGQDSRAVSSADCIEAHGGAARCASCARRKYRANARGASSRIGRLWIGHQAWCTRGPHIRCAGHGITSAEQRPSSEQRASSRRGAPARAKGAHREASGMSRNHTAPGGAPSRCCIGMTSLSVPTSYILQSGSRAAKSRNCIGDRRPRRFVGTAAPDVMDAEFIARRGEISSRVAAA